jgi:hypothetical protein
MAGSFSIRYFPFAKQQKNPQNHWVSGLRPSFGILTGSVSETLCFQIFIIPDNGESPETQ